MKNKKSKIESYPNYKAIPECQGCVHAHSNIGNFTTPCSRCVRSPMTSDYYKSGNSNKT